MDTTFNRNEFADSLVNNSLPFQVM